MRSFELANFSFLQEDQENDTELQPTPDASIAQESAIGNAAHVIRGTSWFDAAAFYVAKVPWDMSMKLPAILLIMALMSRTVGLGMLSPVNAIMKAVWILLRIFFDYVTDTDGGVDVWYWAFCVALVWPIRNVSKYAWAKQMDSPRVSVVSQAASVRSRSHSSRSGGGSVSVTPSARKSTAMDGAIRASPHSANYLLLQGKTNRPMATCVCEEKNTRWCSVYGRDVVEKRRGKRNQFYGSTWLKLCAQHASEYEEWAQSQTRARAGCNDYRADEQREGVQNRFRCFHSDRETESKKVEKHESPSGSGVRSASSNGSTQSEPCDRAGGRRGEQEDQTRTGGHHGKEGRLDGGLSPLSRVMNLQKRAMKFKTKDDEDLPRAPGMIRRQSCQSSMSER